MATRSPARHHRRGLAVLTCRRSVRAAGPAAGVRRPPLLSREDDRCRLPGGPGTAGALVELSPSGAAEDPVAQVQGALPLQRPEELEPDVPRREAVEQATAPPEQDRDEVDLDLVEQPRREDRLGR